MSHFAGLVIMTPEYAQSHTIEDSLERYYEGREVPEYKRGEVTLMEKIDFLLFYEDDGNNRVAGIKFLKGFIKWMRGKKGFITKKKFTEENPNMSDYGYMTHLAENNGDRYLEYFNKTHPGLMDRFADEYKEHGQDWNGSSWRPDENRVWSEYTTYNPESKWDWYDENGRWSECIKTKSGEYVNYCLLGEIDLTPFKPEDYEEGTDWLGQPCRQLKDGIRYHFTKDSMPYCLVIDGVWYERGQMGWWGMSSNDKDKEVWEGEFLDLIGKLPYESEVWNIDFHI